jgi:hypothetical protein
MILVVIDLFSASQAANRLTASMRWDGDRPVPKAAIDDDVSRKRFALDERAVPLLDRDDA